MRRFLPLSALALVLALPLVSHAQAAPPAATSGPVLSAAPGIGEQLLGFVTTPSGIATSIAVLGTILGLALGPSAVRRRRVALAVYHAFHIVEDIDSELDDGDNGKLDKLKAGLKAADDYLKANGWRALKADEQQVAQLGFQSLHGEDKVAEKLAVAAAEAGAKAAAPAVAIASATASPS